MEKKEKTELSNNLIVGAKEYKVYFRTVMTLFDRGMKEVVIKARGKNIKKAIDISAFIIDKNESISLKKMGLSRSSFKPADSEKEIYTSEVEIILQK